MLSAEEKKYITSEFDLFLIQDLLSTFTKCQTHIKYIEPYLAGTNESDLIEIIQGLLLHKYKSLKAKNIIDSCIKIVFNRNKDLI